MPTEAHFKARIDITTGDSGKNINEINENIRQTASQLKQTSTVASSDIKKILDNSKKNAKEFQQQIATTIGVSTQYLKKLGISFKENGDLISISMKNSTINIGKDTENIKRYLTSLEKVKFGKHIAEQNSLIEKSFASLKKTIANFSISFLALRAGRMIFNDVIHTLKEISKVNIELQIATGSVEKANDTFWALGELTKNMPLNLLEVTEGFAQMRTLGLNPTAKSIEAFGNIAAATGHSLVEVEYAIDRITQGYFGLAPLKLGTTIEKHGKDIIFTTKGISKAVKFERDTIVDYFTTVGQSGEYFGKAMEKQAETVQGKITQLGNSWVVFVDKFRKSDLAGWLADVSKSTLDLGSRTLDRIDAHSEYNKFLDKLYKDSEYLQKKYTKEKYLTEIVPNIDVLPKNISKKDSNTRAFDDLIELRDIIKEKIGGDGDFESFKKFYNEQTKQRIEEILKSNPKVAPQLSDEARLNYENYIEQQENDIANLKKLAEATRSGNKELEEYQKIQYVNKELDKLKNTLGTEWLKLTTKQIEELKKLTSQEYAYQKLAKKAKEQQEEKANIIKKIQSEYQRLTKNELSAVEAEHAKQIAVVKGLKEEKKLLKEIEVIYKDKRNNAIIDELGKSDNFFDGLKLGMLEFQKENENFAKKTADIWKNALDKIGDNIYDLVKDGKADFASLFDSIARDLTKALVSDTLSSITGKIFNSNSGVSLPKFHTGGVVGATEREALLQVGETVFTKNQTKALGGMLRQQTGNIYITNNVSDKVKVNANRSDNGNININISDLDHFVRNTVKDQMLHEGVNNSTIAQILSNGG